MRSSSGSTGGPVSARRVQVRVSPRWCVCRRCEFVGSQVPPVRRHDAERDRPGFMFEANCDARHRKKVVDEPVVTMSPSRSAELASPSHAVCEEVPEPMDASNHLDVAVEQLGVARGASQYDSPAADELARGVEGLFKRAPQFVALARLGQDGVEVALERWRSVRRIKDLCDAYGLSGPVAAAVVVMKNDRQYGPCILGGFG